MIEDEVIKEELLTIVKELSTIMGEIALGKSKLQEESLVWLKQLIKKYEENNGIITEFVLPGQNLLSSRIHITRCVARRCELTYAKVYDQYKTSLIIFEYLNKLSTLFYDLALRYEK
jgi:cob(I)alamin adenosyltransferase